MNSKDALELARYIEETEPEEHDFEKIVEFGSYLNEKGKQGMKIILERMSEEDFVKLSRLIKKTLLTALMSEGEGTILLAADRYGELDGFFHTTFLNLIGILAEAEVI